MISTGFVVSWTMPEVADHNGILRNYTVSVTEENTGSVVLLTTHNTSQRVESLHPHYNYTCAVSAVTVSAGPFSTPITITTAESGTPSYGDKKPLKKGLSLQYYSLMLPPKKKHDCPLYITFTNTSILCSGLMLRGEVTPHTHHTTTYI